jgi:hypothetical protein
MATATKKEILPVPVAPKVEITLVLSLDEATTLRDITYLIAGTQLSRRRHSDAIGSALRSILGFPKDVIISDVDLTERAIHFL